MQDRSRTPQPFLGDAQMQEIEDLSWLDDEPGPPTERDINFEYAVGDIMDAAKPDSCLFTLDMAFRHLDHLSDYGLLSESETEAVLEAIARLRVEGRRRDMPDWFDEGLSARAGAICWWATRPQRPASREARRNWPPAWVLDANARFLIAKNLVRNLLLVDDIETRRQETREAHLRDGLKAVADG